MPQSNQSKFNSSPQAQLRLHRQIDGEILFMNLFSLHLLIEADRP